MENRIRITILVDNRVDEGLTAEHGFALWIEINGKHILFDTGQGDALQENVKALGVDLSKTNILVLSHGHYDHTGGVADVLQHACGIELYCHPNVLNSRYSIRNGIIKLVQMPQESIDSIRRFPPERIHWVTTPVFISDCIGITGPIPRITDFEDTGGPFYLDPCGINTDPITDDMALWIEKDDRVIIFTGCSHSGLINTINYVRRLTGNKRIQAVIGGFHLVNASTNRMEKTIHSLCSMNLDMVIPCHCTGENATLTLQHNLGKRVISGKAGMIIPNI